MCLIHQFEELVHGCRFWRRMLPQEFGTCWTAIGAFRSVHCVAAGMRSASRSRSIRVGKNLRFTAIQGFQQFLTGASVPPRPILWSGKFRWRIAKTSRFPTSEHNSNPMGSPVLIVFIPRIQSETRSFIDGRLSVYTVYVTLVGLQDCATRVRKRQLRAYALNTA